MINGNAQEFIAGLYYGDERFFLYNGRKYFIQGYYENGNPVLELYVLEPADSDFRWRSVSTDDSYPVAEFEKAEIFDNKTFWEVEKDMEWVDC